MILLIQERYNENGWVFEDRIGTVLFWEQKKKACLDNISDTSKQSTDSSDTKSEDDKIDKKQNDKKTKREKKEKKEKKFMRSNMKDRLHKVKDEIEDSEE